MQLRAAAGGHDAAGDGATRQVPTAGAGVERQGRAGVVQFARQVDRAAGVVEGPQGELRERASQIQGAAADDDGAAVAPGCGIDHHKGAGSGRFHDTGTAVGKGGGIDGEAAAIGVGPHGRGRGLLPRGNAARVGAHRRRPT